MNIDAEAIKTTIVEFRKEHRCNRVFLVDDECFPQKCDSFRLAAQACFGVNEPCDALLLKDEIIWSEDDRPKSIEICKSDVIAVFDNTKIGFFGNISRSECNRGALVTKKGIVTLNDTTIPSSGFVSWQAFLVGNQSGMEYGEGANVFIYTDSEEETKRYPKGPEIAFHFGLSKLGASDLYSLFRKIKSVLKDDKDMES